MKNQKGFMVPLAIVVIVAVIGGAVYYLNKDDSAMMKDDTAMMEDKDSMTDDSSMMEKDDSAMMEGGEGSMMEKKQGAYLPYSSDKLALADNGDVVLFFRASWCPTCRALDANIKANLDKIPEGVTILDVDYDKSSSLRAKYGVTYQHTLVQVDSSGNMITKWSGSPTLTEFLTHIK